MYTLPLTAAAAVALVHAGAAQVTPQTWVPPATNVATGNMCHLQYYHAVSGPAFPAARPRPPARPARVSAHPGPRFRSPRRLRYGALLLTHL